MNAQRPRPPAWLCLAVLFPRLCYLFPVFSAPDRFSQPDSGRYLDLAHNLWSHAVYSASANVPFLAETKYVLGYPLFLGFWTTFLHLSISWGIVVQLTLNVIAVYCFWAWLSSLATPKKAAIGTLIFSLDFVTLSHVPLLITENLFLFVEVLATIQTWRAMQKPNWLSWIGCGLLWSAACMVRPVSIFFPFFLLGLFFPFKKYAGAFLIAAYLFPAAWCVRNGIQTGHANFSSQGGTDMLMYTAADLVATQTHQGLDDVQNELIIAIDAEHPGGYANASEKSAVYGRVAFDIIRKHPVLMARHAGIGACRLLAGTGFEIPLQQFGFSAPYRGIYTLSAPRGRGTIELLHHYPWLVPLQLFYWIVLGTLYVIFVKKILALWCEGLKNKAFFFFSGVFYFIAVSSMHVGYYRMRIPIMPFLIAGAMLDYAKLRRGEAVE